MTDVVSRLWGFAHKLRHDGVDYGDYLEQITCLLFLKMADEQEIDLPEETDWPHLRKQSGIALVEHYEDALRILGKQPGTLGDIFAGSQNRIGNPATLSQLIKSVDEMASPPGRPLSRHSILDLRPGEGPRPPPIVQREPTRT
jgi:type I restriction enzyme M protein